MNTLNESEFKQDNQQSIDEKKEQPDSSKIKAGDASLYFGTQKTKSDTLVDNYIQLVLKVHQKLERIKVIKDSIPTDQRGKAGFAENDEAYLEWARVAYDGTVCNVGKILKENTPLELPNHILHYNQRSIWIIK